MGMLRLRQWAAALGWLIMVDCYLRPSELTEMAPQQVLPRDLRANMRKVALVLNPGYAGKYSKTGEIDERVLVMREWLYPLIERYAALRQNQSRLWPFNLKQLRSIFLAAAKETGILALKPVLYMARHPGPSIDRYNNTLPLSDVAKRGRWRSKSSLARYEKRAMLQDTWQALSAGAQAYCLRAEAALLGVLHRSLPRTA